MLGLQHISLFLPQGGTLQKPLMQRNALSQSLGAARGQHFSSSCPQ